jgi:hypothetical protein
MLGEGAEGRTSDPPRDDRVERRGGGLDKRLEPKEGGAFDEDLFGRVEVDLSLSSEVRIDVTAVM